MTVFEFLYYLGCSIKKHSALKNQKKLPHKVISLGNITLGGTGKTPAAIALAREAQGRGFRPCILTRGYKGKAEGPCFVSKGEGPLLDEYQAGDEAILMAEKLKGVLIVKGSNRYEAGMFALNVSDHDHKPDLFILDDGFQHWALFRDKNILLIDSTNPFGNRRLIPLGPLREPIKEIKRADIVVITKRSAVSGQQSGEELVTEIRRYNTNAPVFLAEHRPLAFQTVKGETFPPEWAKDKKFFGFCGIGSPQSFKKTLLSADAKMELKGLITFRDHHRYTAGDLQMIMLNAERTGAEWIVTTEKDIMRLKELDMPEHVVSLAIEFSIEEKFYDEVFNEMQNSK